MTPQPARRLSSDCPLQVHANGANISLLLEDSQAASYSPVVSAAAGEENGADAESTKGSVEEIARLTKLLAETQAQLEASREHSEELERHIEKLNGDLEQTAESSLKKVSFQCSDYR